MEPKFVDVEREFRVTPSGVKRQQFITPSGVTLNLKNLVPSVLNPTVVDETAVQPAACSGNA